MGLKTALAIFPGGTANLMAVELRNPEGSLEGRPELAVDEHIEAIHSIDVGRCGIGYFLLRLVWVSPRRKVEYADRGLKDRFGVMAYTLAALSDQGKDEANHH